MTARTKAAKLAAKRGRPLKDVPYREPNGRASRSAEPADKVALEARARHTFRFSDGSEVSFSRSDVLALKTEEQLSAFVQKLVA